MSTNSLITMCLTLAGTLTLILKVCCIMLLSQYHVHAKSTRRPCLHVFPEEKEEYDVTGGKVYTKSCEALGIIPATYFLRTVQAKKHNICMAHHGIGPKGAKAISVALVVSSSLIGHFTCKDYIILSPVYISHNTV